MNDIILSSVLIKKAAYSRDENYETWLFTVLKYFSISAEIEVAIVDKASKLKLLLDHKDKTPPLRLIVCMEAWDASETQRATSMGVTLLAFSDLEVRLGAGGGREVGGRDWEHTGLEQRERERESM